jgi:hypothetical protein
MASPGHEEREGRGGEGGEWAVGGGTDHVVENGDGGGQTLLCQEERNRTDVRASELVVAAGAATRGQVEAREVRAVAVRPIGGRRTGIGTATAEAEQSNRLSKFVSALP